MEVSLNVSIKQYPTSDYFVNSILYVFSEHNMNHKEPKGPIGKKVIASLTHIKIVNRGTFAQSSLHLPFLSTKT